MRLRQELRAIASELGRQSKFYHHDDVIRELRDKRPDLLRLASKALENIALKRILNDVERKQPKSADPLQLSMLPELAGLPLSIPLQGKGDAKGARLLLQKSSVRDVRLHLVDKPSPQTKKTRASLQSFLAEAAEFIESEDMTLEEVVMRLRGTQKS